MCDKMNVCVSVSWTCAAFFSSFFFCSCFCFDTTQATTNNMSFRRRRRRRREKNTHSNFAVLCFFFTFNQISKCSQLLPSRRNPLEGRLKNRKRTALVFPSRIRIRRVDRPNANMVRTHPATNEAQKREFLPNHRRTRKNERTTKKKRIYIYKIRTTTEFCSSTTATAATISLTEQNSYAVRPDQRRVEMN